MNPAGALEQRASQSPVGTFLTVLLLYSGVVVAALYAAFGSAFPGVAAIPYAWGPMVSAGVTVWLRNESVRDWAGQLRNLRAGIHWYLAGIGVMLLGSEFESIVAALLGADITSPAAPPLAYVLNFAITLFLAGALEELGWRGFLQPRLQQHVSALSASLAIGIVWALWHVPMILAGAGDFAAFHAYVPKVVAISVLLGWLYNNTGGALPAVMLAHATHNMPPFSSAAGDAPVVFGALPGDAVFYVLCASVMVLYAGARTLTRDGTLPGVPGRLGEQLPRRGSGAD